MKNNKVLALALSAGLVVAGFNTAHAAETWDGYGDDYAKSWEDASREQDEKLAAEKEADAGETDSEWKPEGSNDYLDAWKDASREQDEKLAAEKEAEELNNAKEEAKQALKDAGITSDFYANLLDKARSVDGVNALRDETIAAHKKSQVDPGKKVTIDEWNLNNAKEEAKQALKDAGVTSDLYAKQIDKANTIEGVNALRDEIIESHKKSQVDPGKKVTIDEWNLNNAKEDAIKALKEAGITSDFFLNQIRKAKTIEGVESLKNDLLKSHKDSSKVDPDKLTTIDDWNLKNAKEDAIKELKEAGITSDFFLNQIRKAKTIEGVESLKNDLLKSHKDSSKVDPDKLTTIDDWNLKNAKEDAIKELKEAGITSDFFLNQIRKAKTIEGVEALKNELLKSRKEDKKSMPWTELEPSNPKKLGEDDKEIVVPSPVLPEDKEDKKDDSVVIPVEDKEEDSVVVPVEDKEEDKEDTTTSKEVDDLIKELDDRTEEIQKELEKIDSTITDDNQKPADEDKKPVDDKKPSDEDKKPSNEDDDANAQPSKDKKDKVVVKDIIKEVKEAVRVPAASHNNPKTGVADLSAVAGTLAISMAGIVATRKKND